MPSKYDPDYDVNSRKRDVEFIVDMSPSTIQEANENRGLTRTTAPVGPEQTGPFISVGSRGITDTETAKRLGVDGQSK